MKNNPRRDQILKTAQKRFARHGLTKTTIEEIARDLRIGKATVYHYFLSKEAIFYDVITGEIDKLIEDLRENLFKDGIELPERIFNYFRVKENISEKYPLIFELINHFFKDQALEKDIEIQKSLFQKESDLILDFLKSSFNKKTTNISIATFLVYQSWGLVIMRKVDPNFKSSDHAFLSVFITKLQTLFLN
ncbi:MAG: TetR/AcrR family transcriptional regulator [Ignavibacteriales bacterium]|nr:TetR/AcrR family transcriptional regulator [Ignavibacteriales bacterium]